MRVLEEKGDKDRLNAAKTETEDYFKIKFPLYQYGQDNRAITVDESAWSITNALSAIKGFGAEMGNIFYECSQQGHEHFVDVLLWLDKRSIKSARVIPLINIGYFSAYGNIPELNRIVSIFDMFKQGTAKTIKKEKVKGTPLETILSRHATGQNAKGIEPKSFSITDMDGLLINCEEAVKGLGLQDLPLKVKMAKQLDILGYIELTTNREEDRRKLIVTDLAPLKNKENGNIWAYAVFTKSVGSGKNARLTLRAKAYDQKPFKKSDIIYATSLAKERSGYWYLYEYDLIV